MTELPLTRESLLIELGKRSDLAWIEFLNIYESAIVRYCKSRGLQEADALDATQAVYEAVQQKLPTWDADGKQGSFRAWLFRVARNVSVDLLVARSRPGRAVGDTQNAALLAEIRDYRPNSNAATTNDDSTEFQLELRRALFNWASSQVKNEVRSVTWQAFRLAAIDGQKADAVAEQLGVSVGSVYTAKCRVMARIRETVQRWQEVPDQEWSADMPDSDQQPS